MDASNTITSLTELRKIYAQPKGRAIEKVLPQLETHSRRFVQNAPFVLLSTVSREGKMDVSPRGGAAGFVYIENDTTLLLPDYKGNNRLDSLTNILETGNVGLIFLLPGIDETLRMNGTACITTSSDILSKFTQEAKAPISCLIVTIEEVFLHCAKALMRSKLWDANTYTDPEKFPSMGQMLQDQIGNTADIPESRTAMIERYKKDL